MRTFAPIDASPRPQLAYQSGFGNEFASEALPGALPLGRNSPQRVPYGLYAEQFSGTGFTVPRAHNRRSWLYRIRPSAVHEPYRRIPSGSLTNDFRACEPTPNQLRWDPLAMPTAPVDFLGGLVTMAGNGDPAEQRGFAIHLYAANRSMERFFSDADGELLIVPQRGRLRIATEFGVLEIGPSEFAVLPRGVRVRVELVDGEATGYVCENFGAPFGLPELGPIGANGLANPRDFLCPVAAYEDRDGAFELVHKFAGNLWEATLDHSPLDVVAWHGTSAPFKYDLAHFNAFGSVSFDHPDPSIFTVLQSPSETVGSDNIDFVVFPPRWLAMEDTFRPPWFHRNISSEFMGLIDGIYDGKAGGFVPGGASLHNSMSGHGPDLETFERALAADTRVPERISGGLAFMFETRWLMKPTRFALETPSLQADYVGCWRGLPKRFTPGRP